MKRCGFTLEYAPPAVTSPGGVSDYRDAVFKLT